MRHLFYCSCGGPQDGTGTLTGKMKTSVKQQPSKCDGSNGFCITGPHESPESQHHSTVTLPIGTVPEQYLSHWLESDGLVHDWQYQACAVNAYAPIKIHKPATTLFIIFFHFEPFFILFHFALPDESLGKALDLFTPHLTFLSKLISKK